MVGGCTYPLGTGRSAVYAGVVPVLLLDLLKLLLRFGVDFPHCEERGQGGRVQLEGKRRIRWPKRRDLIYPV
jgi:hypothetical protein